VLLPRSLKLNSPSGPGSHWILLIPSLRTKFGALDVSLVLFQMSMWSPVGRVISPARFQ
jgi:hypothetical protein